MWGLGLIDGATVRAVLSMIVIHVKETWEKTTPKFIGCRSK